MGKDVYIGFDIGSSAVHYAVLRADKGEDSLKNRGAEVAYAPGPLNHFADIRGTLQRAWDDIFSRFPEESVTATGFTGSGARGFRELCSGFHYEFESVSIPRGVFFVSPQTEYIFHIGAKDPYFFHSGSRNGKLFIQNWAAGSKCGGGSGTLLEKQVRRLFEADFPQKEEPGDNREHPEQGRLREMFEAAEHEAGSVEKADEFLARCGVVIQSDLIHEQNTGTPREMNLARLFRTVARNYRNDVLGSLDVSGVKAVGTGGVMLNGRILKELAGFTGSEISRFEYATSAGAVGAAVSAAEVNCTTVITMKDIESAMAGLRSEREFAPPLSVSMTDVETDEQDSRFGEIADGTETVLGIDGGSTTTKGVLISLETGELLDKIYLKTHGNPEKALKQVLSHLGRHRDKISVKGVSATGSARKLYERVLISSGELTRIHERGGVSVDSVPDEITCHALGVKYHNPSIDTIFEIGGQDMKFTTFRKENGNVTDSVERAEMNYSCQAGSGQTMENMGELIHLDVTDGLQEAALRAQRVPVIDSTCGVFMEMDVNRLIGSGFTRDEIAAAIIRATAASYYYKFVGGSAKVGEACSAQGGPALGRAFLAALAQVSGRKIFAFPHREVFGAWGAALDVRNNILEFRREGKEEMTAFRGWGIIDMTLLKERVRCADLFGEKSCTRRDCQLESFTIGDDTVLTGGFCPLGNSETAAKPAPDYVNLFHRLFEKHFTRFGKLQGKINGVAGEFGTIGVKRCTSTLGEKGIWSAALWSALGFIPVLSGISDDEIARVGVNSTHTDFCFARKLATGHAEILRRDAEVKYLFNPSFISYIHNDGFSLTKYCIFTESEGFLLNDALGLDLQRQVNPILNFGDMNLLADAFRTEFRRLGIPIGQGRIKKAIRFADRKEREFMDEIAGIGDIFLKKMSERGEKGFVGIGRDYVILDPKASSDSGHMLSRVRGLNYIPQIYLKHRFSSIPIDHLVEREYWEQTALILQCCIYTAEHKDLFPVRMLNFGCGPDSIKLFQEEKIFESASKPLLTFMTDAQTNNAPFVTRTEAHEQVVRKSSSGKVDQEQVSVRRRSIKNDILNREWVLPYIGDNSYIGSAVLHHFHIDSRVLPTNTPEGHECADRHLHTEVCYPLKGVVSDVLGFLNSEADRHGRDFVNRKYLIMIPSAGGPCRFGKYREAVRIFLDDEGFKGVPIEGPSPEYDYTDLPIPGNNGAVSHKRIMQLFYRGLYSADLLEDITLRYRPYARVREDADSLKKRRMEELCACLSRNGSMRAVEEWAEETVRAFTRLDLKTEKRYPLVLYMGEIYMRQHDPYTDNVIHMIEEQELEVVRSPMYEWLHYINELVCLKRKRTVKISLRNLNLAKSIHSMGKWFGALVRQKYMHHQEHLIGRPFESAVQGRQSASPSPAEIIRELEKGHYFHHNIEGESPLSIGLGYFFMNDMFKSVPEEDIYISGLFHVGPFTCMQEGVATAKIDDMIRQLRKTKKDLLVPLIHAFFGDSPNPNLESEIAVFREQCYLKKEELKSKI